MMHGKCNMMMAKATRCTPKQLVTRYATLEGEFELLNQDFIINQPTQVRFSVYSINNIVKTFEH